MMKLLFSAVVMFLVYEVERNIFDHRYLEYAIYNVEPKVKVIRRTMKDVQALGMLTSDRRLTVEDMEIAIVYMRCCYKPSDYEDEDAWKTRLMMERSRAVVCPTAAYQLAGTKKVQQVLSAPGVVERFIKDVAAVNRIRSTFAEQFSLDLDEEGDSNTQMGIDNPHLFVLKPQREGGGNNTYGESVRTELKKLMFSKQRSSYILMKRIHPLVVRNYPIAAEQPVVLKDMVNELGIYGTLVANGDEVVLNKQQGYLLRTKPVGTDEGGVATGYSVLDSPYLVDSWPPVKSGVKGTATVTNGGQLVDYQMLIARNRPDRSDIVLSSNSGEKLNKKLVSQSDVTLLGAKQKLRLQGDSHNKVKELPQELTPQRSRSALDDLKLKTAAPALSALSVTEPQTGDDSIGFTERTDDETLDVDMSRHSAAVQTEIMSQHSIAVQTDETASKASVQNSRAVLTEMLVNDAVDNETDESEQDSKSLQSRSMQAEAKTPVIESTDTSQLQVKSFQNRHVQTEVEVATKLNAAVQTDSSTISLSNIRPSVSKRNRTK